MLQELRLPLNWRCLSLYAKFQYLCNSGQARHFSHAAQLLNQRKKQLVERTKEIRQEAFCNARLPYADN